MVARVSINNAPPEHLIKLGRYGEDKTSIDHGDESEGCTYELEQSHDKMGEKLVPILFILST